MTQVQMHNKVCINKVNPNDWKCMNWIKRELFLNKTTVRCAAG